MSDQIPNGDSANESVEKRVSSSFQKLLDQHGYSFQQAIASRAEELRDKETSTWNLFGTEVPVNCRNQSTHIDIVLTAWNRRRTRHSGYFLVAECKRVNPAKGHWCFAKTPYTWPNHLDSYVQFDQVLCYSAALQFSSTTKSILTSQKGVYNLGIEVRTGEKGDSSGQQPQSAINSAVGQVFRSASGFINYVCDNSRNVGVLSVDEPEIIIPAIFTTARLFTTQADLGSASLENGLLPPHAVEVAEHDWIWFNVNRSINLAHDVRFDHSDNNERHMEPRFREFTRTVAIVSSKGVDSFLSMNLSEQLR
jgi:hypothetical protein